MSQAANDPAGATSPFENHVHFIDFGCGAGKSMEFLRRVTGGQGLGIDLSEAAVAACRQSGFPAEIGDVLSYTGRNTAVAITAVDLLPEVGDRADFEQAVSRMILAARNYVFLQHNFYDADSALALNGLHVAAHFDRRLRFKPGMADYATLLARLANSHSISGFAFFGVGEPRLIPLGLEDAAPERPAAALPATYRSLRVIIGRKEVDRFQAALRRGRAGQQLFLWQRSDGVA